MERAPIKGSKNIAEVGYDADKRVMELKFLNGGVYRYHDIPQPVYDAFRSADSMGSFLHARIKGVYKFTKIGESFVTTIRIFAA